MNNSSRRHFLKMAGLAGAGIVSACQGILPSNANTKRITLLHTNDTHSRIDPYPDNDPNFPGMGGYARRAALINHFRKEDPELILLDAGDYFQGTPYFNFYKGKPELELMSKMGYDAVTIGNHEFDNGLEDLLDMMQYANFPFVSANLDFSKTILKGKTTPYIVLKRNKVRVGIYGLGINPSGLVSPMHYQETRYLDPIEIARYMEQQLKTDHRCELIICLSHLGYRYQENRVSDIAIAENTSYTDIIIGGHTHTLLDPPVAVNNARNLPVYIGQTGSGGVRLGVMNIYFEPGSDEKETLAYTTKIIKNQGL
jgi:5'-nucleotidase